MRGLFRIVSRRLVQSPLGRWVLAIILLALGGLTLAAYPSEAGQNALAALIGGIFFLAFGLFVLIFTILITIRARGAKQEGEANAKRLLAEGRLLPIPPVPKTPLKGATADDLARAESYAKQMREIRWGEQV